LLLSFECEVNPVITRQCWWLCS